MVVFVGQVAVEDAAEVVSERAAEVVSEAASGIEDSRAEDLRAEDSGDSGVVVKPKQMLMQSASVTSANPEPTQGPRRHDSVPNPDPNLSQRVCLAKQVLGVILEHSDMIPSPTQRLRRSWSHSEPPASPAAMPDQGEDVQIPYYVVIHSDLLIPSRMLS